MTQVSDLNFRQFVHKPIVLQPLVILDKLTHQSVLICSSKFCNYTYYLYNYQSYFFYNSQFVYSCITFLKNFPMVS
jgi:hypothetical protein